MLYIHRTCDWHQCRSKIFFFIIKCSIFPDDLFSLKLMLRLLVHYFTFWDNFSTEMEISRSHSVSLIWRRDWGHQEAEGCRFSGLVTYFDIKQHMWGFADRTVCKFPVQISHNLWDWNCNKPAFLSTVSEHIFQLPSPQNWFLHRWWCRCCREGERSCDLWVLWFYSQVCL